MTKTTRVIRAAAMSVLFVVGAAVSANAGVTAEIDPLMTRWKPKVRVEGVPPHVFVEVKKTQKGYAVLLMNYNPSERVSGAKVFFDSECVDIPPFDLYWLQAE